MQGLACRAQVRAHELLQGCRQLRSRCLMPHATHKGQHLPMTWKASSFEPRCVRTMCCRRYLALHASWRLQANSEL